MPGTSPPNEPLRILLLEDNDWDAKMTSEALVAALPSSSVSRAATLADAKAKLDAQSWDAVLVDLNVTDSKGLATLQRVLGLGKQAMAVVAVTGVGDEKMAQQALAMGAQDFLQKGDTLAARIGRTITYAVERQRLAAALMGMGEMQMRILDAMGDYLIVSDLLGHVRQVNPALAEVLGPGWRGKSIYDYVPAERRVQAITDTGKMQAVGKSAGEAPLTAVDGTIHQILWTGTVLRDDAGNPSGMVAVGKDVTELRRLEAESAAAQRVMDEAAAKDQAEKDRTQLINAVAHELNNPLTPIKLQLAILARSEVRQNDSLRVAIPILERNVDRMAAIISDMLDIARLQGGRMRIDLKPKDLQDLCREMSMLFAPQAAEKGITLGFHPTNAMVAEVDPSRFGQILINLLSNSVKFTPTGGQIQLTCAIQGHEAVLEVTDSGKGMTEDELGRLFRPFALVNPEDAKGLGLGLFISKGIAAAHGGSLTASSPGTGKGSTFTVRVPLRAPNKGGAAPAPMAAGP